MARLSKAQLLKKEQKEIEFRYYHRNWKAMSWCNKQGYTVYASAQASNSNMVKLFKQKGEHFKPLNNVLYDQTNDADIMKYIAEIDKEYERMYNLKNKSK